MQDQTNKFFRIGKYLVTYGDDGNLYDKKGNKLCQHGLRSSCRACFPFSKNPLCPHGSRKSRCPQCKGKGLCEHDKQKGQCATCRDMYGHGLGKFYCPVSRIAVRDCPHCKGKAMEVVKTIKKDDERRKNEQSGQSAPFVTLDDLGSVPAIPGIIKYKTAFADDGELDLQSGSDDDFALQEIMEPGSASESRAFVSASASAPGAFSGDHSDSESVGKTFNSENWWNQGGGKRKRHFTRRLRRNHNTKKKSKLVKRKTIKRSRKINIKQKSK